MQVGHGQKEIPEIRAVLRFQVLLKYVLQVQAAHMAVLRQLVGKVLRELVQRP